MTNDERKTTPITIHEAAQLALVAGRNEDITALLQELHSIIPILQRDLERNPVTTAGISRHPIVHLYVDQMHHLAHKCLNGHALERHLRAVQECQKIADGDVVMR